MILNSDFFLKQPIWFEAEEKLMEELGIFDRLVDIFILAVAIGVKDDKRIKDEDGSNEYKTIGRNTYGSTLNTDLNDLLHYFLQNALITSNTIDYDIDERLKLAFDPEYNVKNFSGTNFLVEFANYGINEIMNNVNSKSYQVVSDQLNSYFTTLSEFDFSELLQYISLEDL